VKDAAEYLAQVKALIVMNPEIVHWTALREEAQGDVGFFRYTVEKVLDIISVESE